MLLPALQKPNPSQNEILFLSERMSEESKDLGLPQVS